MNSPVCASFSSAMTGNRQLLCLAQTGEFIISFDAAMEVQEVDDRFGINIATVIDFLHFHRSIKTDYELACLRQAQKLAVAGHRAAKEAFSAGLSEFDINQAYLTATGHRDTDVPYGNIIALNEHAAVPQRAHSAQ